jgi:hypothetical protein
MAMMGKRGGRRFVLVGAGLGAALLSACGDDNPCIPSQCTSGALLQIPVGTSAAALVGTTATVCRNTECYTATLPEVPAAGGGGVGVFFTDTAPVSGTLWQAPTGTIELDLEWQLDSTQVQDGDHYAVTFTSAAGTATTLLDQTATYAPTAPGPGECSGGPVCRIAVLAP